MRPTARKSTCRRISATELVPAVKPGDAVTIRGLKAHAIPMIQAISITSDEVRPR